VQTDAAKRRREKGIFNPVQNEEERRGDKGPAAGCKKTATRERDLVDFG
jgi:hypothetical protein